MRKKIIIYGGAFNPPHVGHAIVVETLSRLMRAHEIWIMPSADRKDKYIGISGEDRSHMLQLLLKDTLPKTKAPLKISSFEIERPALTTTYDTKLALEKKYPNFDFYFVVGSDLISDVKTKWVKGRELYKSARFVVIKRAPFKLPKKVPGNISMLSAEGIWPELSSTFIRKLLARGYSGMPYLTQSVAKYAQNKKFYKK